LYILKKSRILVVVPYIKKMGLGCSIQDKDTKNK